MPWRQDTAKIYQGWGLNQTELRIIAQMTPKRDYYYQGRQGHRLFQLHLGPVGLAFAGASRKADLAQMAALYQGSGVQFAVDWLHARGLHQDADYLKSEGGAMMTPGVPYPARPGLSLSAVSGVSTAFRPTRTTSGSATVAAVTCS